MGPTGPQGPQGPQGEPGLNGVAFGENQTPSMSLPLGTTRVQSVQFTLPQAGYVVINFSGFASIGADTFIWTGINPTTSPNAFYQSSANQAAGLPYQWTQEVSNFGSSPNNIPFNMQKVVYMEAGTHTISGDIYSNGGVTLYTHHLIAMYFPAQF